MSTLSSPYDLLSKEELLLRLEEAEETLRAIRSGEVDALVVSGTQGDQVFTLKDATLPYQILIEEMNEGALTLSPQGIILYCNACFAEILGFPIENILGKSFLDFILPSDQARALGLLEQKSEGKSRGELTLVGRGGQAEVPVAISLKELILGSELRFGLVITDLTERKQVELELKRHKDDLEMLVHERTKDLQRTLEKLNQSNAELEEFAYIASHDLQEPLRGVASLTELLQHRYQGHLDSRADEYIELIVDGTQRMQALINDLLAYSRAGRRGDVFQSTEAEAALQIALKNLNTAIIETGATITNDSLPKVKADGSQLTQLFQNLIGNAIKFREESPPHIKIRVADAADCWQFSVRDNGIGIEPQFSERIFQVFQRLHTRREYKGTGIGLAICKKIVERHGGRIWVKSELGQGSTFYFTLLKG